MESSTNKLTRSSLVDEMQAAYIERTGGKRIAKADIKILLDAALEAIKEAMQQGGNVRLDRFGTFVVKHYAQTTRQNPQDRSQLVTIPPRTYPSFKPGKELKERVRSGLNTEEI